MDARAGARSAEPVVDDVDDPPVRARRIAIDGDVGEAADPGGRSPVDEQGRPARALVVAPGDADAEPVPAGRRRVRPVQAGRSLGRARTPGDRSVLPRATARAPPRVARHLAPRPAAVVGDPDAGRGQARSGREPLIGDGDGVRVGRMRRHDRFRRGGAAARPRPVTGCDEPVDKDLRTGDRAHGSGARLRGVARGRRRRRQGER